MLTNCWVIKLTQLLGEMHLLKCWAFCVPNMDGQYFAQLLNVLTIRPTLGKKLGIYLLNFFLQCTDLYHGAAILFFSIQSNVIKPRLEGQKIWYLFCVVKMCAFFSNRVYVYREGDKDGCTVIKVFVQSKYM